jgi:hypothetical protein
MIKIVRQIANKNGYDKIYIPEQGSWHALSNRDQVNKEVWNISRQNKNKEDYCIKTEFYCSQLNI